MVAMAPDIEVQKIWQLLKEVPDPEIPVLSILDLGIVRHVNISSEKIEIIITPTYSGCPAMDAISMDIKLKLLEAGFKNISVIYALSPAWTTDWMTEEGKNKLEQYGIAAPAHSSVLNENSVIKCPQCKSEDTVLLSRFGSTACKALYQCNTCKEPFDQFKCH